MISEKQLEANRQNALESAGPRTDEGVEAVELNAPRHGLRSVQTVVPGEDPAAWEGRQAAVIEDMKPAGALEYALAEQVAVKLWRLGRIVLFEANAIVNAQDPEELANSHEKKHHRQYGGPGRTDIPTGQDVQKPKEAITSAKAALESQRTALGQLEGLAALTDDIIIDDWTIFEPLRHALSLGEKEAGGVFKNKEEPFRASHVRALLRKRGKVEEVTAIVVTDWRDTKVPDLQSKLDRARRQAKSLPRRYDSAVKRLHASRPIPADIEIEKIQRYEAHLERSLHKALDRLQMLQEARGANPPTINLGCRSGGLSRPRNGFARQFRYRGRWGEMTLLAAEILKPKLVQNGRIDADIRF